MDFTREPLVETVITPKEGFKLIIRASSGASEEEYSVGAVEVVAFGNCYFFRSLEKPKAFLLPMTEYEVVEARETRTVLKKPKIEKAIKIGGGKKATSKKASSEEEPKEEQPKKKERKRSRKRSAKTDEAPKEEEAAADGEQKEASPPPPRRTLLPPPTSLISEQIDRYKDYLAEQGAITPGDIKAAEKEVAEESAPAEEKVVDIATEAPPTALEESES